VFQFQFPVPEPTSVHINALLISSTHERSGVSVAFNCIFDAPLKEFVIFSQAIVHHWSTERNLSLSQPFPPPFAKRIAGKAHEILIVFTPEEPKSCVTDPV
jgi:hypothetical protein